jgi:Chaperone of endosialidase
MGFDSQPQPAPLSPVVRAGRMQPYHRHLAVPKVTVGPECKNIPTVLYLSIQQWTRLSRIWQVAPSTVTAAFTIRGLEMRRVLSLALVLAIAALGLLVPTEAMARIAEPQAGQSSIEWHANASYERFVLTVSTPGGAVLRREFAAGETPTFSLFDKSGQARASGSYHYELRAVPAVSADVRSRLAAARAAGDERSAAIEQARAGLGGDLVQSGSFAIFEGAITMGDRTEGTEAGGVRNAAAPLRNITAADQVIPDDLIVQGSGCFGFDCVNNESFGFDTIRLKENNLRIKFEDTSVGSFPTNDWQLTANDSASGASSKFSIEDITGARVPFTITAGAATNSIFVDSTGRMGLRTSTPVLDLHINTSNTPAIRLEQNNSGGFTAQTWDIAGNEANFFVRDVTGGSRLPFRIRPGAPTSSLDIAADGDVGIGTASPANKMDIQCDGAAAACGRIGNSNATGFSGWEFERADGTVVANFSVDNAGGSFRLNATNSFPVVILTNSTERIRFPAPGGNVITAANGAFLSSGGTWTSVSSRESKQDIVQLSNGDALKALQGLNPVTFRYKAEPDEQYVGFVAEDVPELVATNSHQHLNPMDVVAVLTKVVQEQQQTIEALSAKIEKLEQASKQ